jgi:DNA-directed RNA polymerase subunit RPC12/RpoP
MRQYDYNTAWFCVSCDAEMSYYTKLHSHGRCFHCGHKSLSSGTIVDTYERGWRKTHTPSGKWWKPDTMGIEWLPKEERL